MKLKDFPTPYYVVYADKLRRNLELISDVSRRSGAKIIMAFKANALWRTFDIIKEYCQDSTASSLNEMRLGNEFLGGEVHSYCPASSPATCRAARGGRAGRGHARSSLQVRRGHD